MNTYTKAKRTLRQALKRGTNAADNYLQHSPGDLATRFSLPPAQAATLYAELHSPALIAELAELQHKATISDQPENAATRTPAELATRYAWSERMHAIRAELQALRNA